LFGTLRNVAVDSAEAWLLEHDPKYVEPKDCPPEETPWGSGEDLQLLVDTGEGKWLPAPQRKTCAACGYLFVPMTPWHRFCGDKCSWKTQKRKQRLS